MSKRSLGLALLGAITMLATAASAQEIARPPAPPDPIVPVGDEIAQPFGANCHFVSRVSGTVSVARPERTDQEVHYAPNLTVQSRLTCADGREFRDRMHEIRGSDFTAAQLGRAIRSAGRLETPMRGGHVCVAEPVARIRPLGVTLPDANASCSLLPGAARGGGPSSLEPEWCTGPAVHSDQRCVVPSMTREVPETPWRPSTRAPAPIHVNSPGPSPTQRVLPADRQ